jgi:hypothetical protein
MCERPSAGGRRWPTSCGRHSTLLLEGMRTTARKQHSTQPLADGLKLVHVPADAPRTAASAISAPILRFCEWGEPRAGAVAAAGLPMRLRT